MQSGPLLAAGYIKNAHSQEVGPITQMRTRVFSRDKRRAKTKPADYSAAEDGSAVSEN